MGDIFKRMIAFVIDWNLCLLPFFTVIFLLTPLAQSNASMTFIYVLLFLVLFFSALAVFVLRDVIFKGRSIGKRIFKLHILDKATRQVASTGKKIAKNLFFFIYTIDGIVLLASGSSIGNYVTNTEVISEKTIARLNNTEYKPVSKKRTWLIVITVIVLILFGFLSLFGVTMTLLENQKNSEEYKLAYNYLVTSEAFEALGADESDIFMNKYSLNTHSSANKEGATQTVTIGFIAKSKSFKVICHNKNGEWQVCENCTKFE